MVELKRVSLAFLRELHGIALGNHELYSFTAVHMASIIKIMGIVNPYIINVILIRIFFFFFFFFFPYKLLEISKGFYIGQYD
jgi:hypothetical protein